MTKLSLLLLAFTGTVPLLADAVTASCGVQAFPDSPPFIQDLAAQGGIQNAGATSAACNVSYSYAYGYTTQIVGAGASLTLSLAQVPGNFNSFQTRQGVTANTGPGTPYGPNGSPTTATTGFDFSDVLTTAGPGRLGLLEIVASGNGFLSTDSLPRIGLTVGIRNPDSGPYAAQTQVGCAANNSAQGCFPPRPDYTVPFQLGTPFLLQAFGGLGVGTYEGVGGSGELSTDYRFRFFEANGFTPVAVSEIPEPSLIGLLLSGVTVLTVRQRIRAAKRARSIVRG